MIRKQARCTYTDEKAISLYKYYHDVGMTQKEAAKKIGCTKGTAGRWLQWVEDHPALLAQARSKKPRTKAPELSVEMPISTMNELDALRDENAFLAWWNQGERNGWVDRLLKKVQDG